VEKELLCEKRRYVVRRVETLSGEKALAEGALCLAARRFFPGF